MKKGIIFFLGFATLITFGLYFFQGYTVEQKDGKQVITRIVGNQEKSLNDFLKTYKSGGYNRIELVDSVQLVGYIPTTGEKISTNNPLLKDIEEKFLKTESAFKPAETTLTELGISLTGKTEINIIFNKAGFLSTLFFEQILPLILFILVLFLGMRYLSPRGGMPFSTSAGKLKNQSDPKTKFTDIAGMDEVKLELSEIVDYLKAPAKYKKVGAKPPKGVLLYGVPGGGKTLLARAVAGEANVPFFSASGSEFMEMLVGLGAAKVRELFSKAKAAGPSIIFIDEIDAIGKRRGNGHTGGHQEQEQTLNQILTEMDGFENDTQIIVIAATNRPDTLDPALLRAGRFDRKVFVGKPTLEERVLIIEYYLRNKKITENVNIQALARKTSGFVGADIETLVNEAALKVARENKLILDERDFEYALEKIIMGPEKKIKSIQENERKIITYHELGHAVTAHLLEHADPVEKISIVSRGMALGVTWMMPQEDKYLISKAKFLDEMVSLLGGRAAEQIFMGKENITTGASNDFEKITRMAYDMITKYGMDDEIGQLNFSSESEYSPYKPYSEQTALIIDQKVKNMVASSYQKALDIIKKNKGLMETLSVVLLEKEYLTKEEFELLMKDPSQSKKILADYKISNEIFLIEQNMETPKKESFKSKKIKSGKTGKSVVTQNVASQPKKPGKPKGKTQASPKKKTKSK